MAAPEPSGKSQSFRPPILLRLLLGAVGILCAVSATGLVLRGAHHGEPQWFAVAALLCAPCLLAAAVACRAVQVTEQALISSSLVRKQEIPWSAIRRLDRRRRSFVVETAAGPVSAGWLAPAERERLMRLIIQRGRLSLSAEEPPWGIEARYLPRAEDIAFVPHHARKKHDSDH